MNELPENIEDMVFSVQSNYFIDKIGLIPICYTDDDIENAVDCVFVKNQSGLDILRRIGSYGYISSLINGFDFKLTCLRKVFLKQSLENGIYIYGAYKVGLTVVREAKKAGIKVKGFIDKDAVKQAALIEGVKVFSPAEVSLQNETVVIAIGRYGNEILNQLQDIKDIKCINTLEFLYTINASRSLDDNYSNFIDRM